MQLISKTLNSKIMKNWKLNIGIIAIIVLSWCNSASAQEANIDSTSGRTIYYTRILARSYGDSIVCQRTNQRTYNHTQHQGLTQHTELLLQAFGIDVEL